MCRLRGTDLVYLVTEYADAQLSPVVPERRLTATERAEMLKRCWKGPPLDQLRLGAHTTEAG